MEAFNLLSIELDKWSGASVAYTFQQENGVTEVKVKMDTPRHPDLTNLFEIGLKSRVAWLLGFDITAEDLPVYPCGAAYPKNGEVVYSAYIEGPVGRYKAKTPKVKFTQEDSDLFALIESEAREYVINGKSAQLSIFGE